MLSKRRHPRNNIVAIAKTGNWNSQTKFVLQWRSILSLICFHGDKVHPPYWPHCCRPSKSSKFAPTSIANGTWKIELFKLR